MKTINLLAAFMLLSIACCAQTKNEREVLDEGHRLYKTEMASWYGTDLFLEKFPSKRESVAGYFSYVDGEMATCVFYSRGSVPKTIASFSFDSTYNLKTAKIDDRERDLTGKEMDLVKLRSAVIAEYQRDTLFLSYENMHPNFIPLNDEKGKRVYVLTGPQKHNIVVFGNDYLITFDDQLNIKEKKRLHKNIIPIEYGDRTDGKVVDSTVHSHLPETGDLITPTDVCTLLLYSRFTGWKNHFVISDKYVSMWNCERNKLIVITTEAWKKLDKK